MWTTIQGWLEAPPSRGMKTRPALLLNIILWILMVASLLYGIFVRRRGERKYVLLYTPRQGIEIYEK